MTWWNIVKISDEAKERITQRYRQTAFPKGRVKGEGKNIDRRYVTCEMCAQRKSPRTMQQYPPSDKVLCNRCAEFKFGPNYKQQGTKIKE